MTDISQNLPHILAEHRKWLRGDGGSRAYLSDADLSGADLSGAYLSRAYLSGADLSGAYLSRAYLSGADLSGAYLSGADLSGADLSGAYLSRAYLSGADLSGAYLSGADLSGADLSRADLSDADLSGAYLSRAYLSGARNLIDGGQRLDGYRFVGWIKGGALMIRAGCRNLTLPEYRTHNAARVDAALRDETTAILDHIEAVARVRGLLTEPVASAEAA